MKIQMLQKNRNFFKTFLWSVSTVLVLSGSVAPVQAAVSSSTVAATVYQGTLNATLTPAGVPLLPAPPIAPPEIGLPPLPIGPGFEEIDRDTLLEVLGMSSDELRTAFESGRSLAQIAASQNADVQRVADLAAQALTVRLSRELKDGILTQSQYQARLNEVEEHAAAIIKRTPPSPPQPGSEADLGLPLGPGLEQLNKDALLQLLGISSSSLADALHNSQSLADIAAAQGIDVQEVTALLAQTMLNRLDQELSEKSIWKDEYETRKQEIAARASDAVQHSHPIPPVPPHAKFSR